MPLQAAPVETSTSARVTWYALADNVPLATGKQHLSIFNPAGSPVLVRLLKLFCIDLTASVAIGGRFDLKRSTAQSGGTAITPTVTDTASGSVLPSGFLAATGATVTEGTLLFPYMRNNALSSDADTLMQTANLLVDDQNNYAQMLVLRPGQGFTVKQIGTSTGTFAWLAVFVIETI